MSEIIKTIGPISNLTEPKARQVMRWLLDPMNQPNMIQCEQGMLMAKILAARLVGQAPEFSKLNPEEKQDHWDMLASRSISKVMCGQKPRRH